MQLAIVQSFNYILVEMDINTVTNNCVANIILHGTNKE